MADQKTKRGLVAIGATLGVALVKGVTVLLGHGGAVAKPAVQFTDEAARATVGATAMADEAVRGGATALQAGAQASHLVEPKVASSAAKPILMSDGERIARSAVEVARTQARVQRRSSEGDDDKAKKAVR